MFDTGSLNKIISVHLLDDNIPEEKEVYQVILYDVRTQGNAEFLLLFFLVCYFQKNS